MNIKESPLGTIRVMAIAATAALLSLTGCGAASTEINLSDYIVFESAGYETYGTAECWFDTASYTKDIDAIFAEKDMWNESKYSQEQMESMVITLKSRRSTLQTNTRISASDLPAAMRVMKSAVWNPLRILTLFQICR